MHIAFEQISLFQPGLLYQLLSDAYSFNPQFEKVNKERWLADDKFFFGDLNIGDRYCFVTTLNHEPIGFLAWDPRNLPHYGIIGDNCIVPKHKGKGYGILQLQEAVSRIAESGAKRIYVSTDKELVPAQKMYERVGFRRIEYLNVEPWQILQYADIYYGMEII